MFQGIRLVARKRLFSIVYNQGGTKWLIINRENSGDVEMIAVAL